MRVPKPPSYLCGDRSNHLPWWCSVSISISIASSREQQLLGILSVSLPVCLMVSVLSSCEATRPPHPHPRLRHRAQGGQPASGRSDCTSGRVLLEDFCILMHVLLHVYHVNISVAWRCVLNTRVCPRTCVCMYKCLLFLHIFYASSWVYMHVCMQVTLWASVYVCIHACVYVCVCVDQNV